MKVRIPSEISCLDADIQIFNSDIDYHDMTIFNEDNPLDITELLSICGISDITLLPKSYIAMMLQLEGNCKDLRFLPKMIAREHLQKISAKLHEIINSSIESEYLSTYITLRTFLSKLLPAKINKSVITSVLESEKNSSILSSINSCNSNDSDFSKIAKYNLAKTSTGRMTIASGPRILTLPTKYRKIFMSRFEDGQLLSIDFRSIEPRIALYMANKEPTDDVYDFIKTQILNNKIDRRRAKLITLSALYGQSSSELQKGLPEGITATDVLSRVQMHFCLSELKKSLRKNTQEDVLKNFVGRPLKQLGNDDHALVSHFLQSSAAEISILIFDKILHSLSSDNVIPLFVIHDALVLDCNKLGADEVKNLLSESIAWKNWKFPLSISQFDS